MTPENQSSRQLEDNKNLKKEIEKLNKVIELQQKTIEHDKKIYDLIMAVDNVYLAIQI